MDVDGIFAPVLRRRFWAYRGQTKSPAGADDGIDFLTAKAQRRRDRRSGSRRLGLRAWRRPDRPAGVLAPRPGRPRGPARGRRGRGSWGPRTGYRWRRAADAP